MLSKLSDSELNRLYRYAFALTHEEERAYDLLHSAVEKVLEVDMEVHNIMAYLRRTIRNIFFDEWRRDQRHPTELKEDLSDVVDLSTDIETLTIQRDVLIRLLKEVSSEDREVLFLWAIEGLTFQEISDELGVSRGTLLSRVSRLRSRMVRSMEREVYDEKTR